MWLAPPTQKLLHLEIIGAVRTHPVKGGELCVKNWLWGLGTALPFGAVHSSTRLVRIPQTLGCKGVVSFLSSINNGDVP